VSDETAGTAGDARAGAPGAEPTAGDASVPEVGSVPGAGSVAGTGSVPSVPPAADAASEPGMSMADAASVPGASMADAEPRKPERHGRSRRRHATPGRSRRRHPLHRLTLRTRLVLSMVALVAVLGVVISLFSALFLQSYLVGRLDEQLTSAAQRGEAVAIQAIGTPGGISTNGLLSDVVRAPGLPPGTVVSLVTSTGGITTYYLSRDPSATQQTASGDVNQRIAAVPSSGSATDVDLGGTLGQYRFVGVELPQSAELVVGLPLSEVTGTTAQLLTIILLVTLAVIVLAGGLGTIIVLLALRPLDRVAATATAVSRLPLDRGEVALAVRVPEQDADPHTEVGRLGAAFNQMLGHVAAALTARQTSENKVRQFVADASHELRTPLASIRGYAELTRRAPEPLPESAVHSLARIESEAERMTDLVEDLLLLARLDEGRELDKDPVDLSRLVIDAVSDAHAAGRDHVWNVDLPGEPVTVIGDEKRLHQVLANILTNARVHTPEGTAVDTALRVEGDKAIVTVTDDGPGIPDDLLPVLFERFARGDPSRARHTGSTGLGLAIVRAVVRAQGGDVTAQSEPGRTTFIVTLPRDVGSQGDASLGQAGVADDESVIDLSPEELAALEAEDPTFERLPGEPSREPSREPWGGSSVESSGESSDGPSGGSSGESFEESSGESSDGPSGGSSGEPSEGQQWAPPTGKPSEDPPPPPAPTSAP
jgi:two-component system OmpR family sensor kinase